MRRFRYSIRSLMVLVVTAGLLAWIVRLMGGLDGLYQFGPYIAIAIIPLYGMVWSISRIYKNSPERQTLSIVILIGSLLGLIFCVPLVLWLSLWLSGAVIA